MLLLTEHIEFETVSKLFIKEKNLYVYLMVSGGAENGRDIHIRGLDKKYRRSNLLVKLKG